VRPPAEAIGTLGLIVGAIAVLIFIGVESALVYVVWRYRASRVATPARFDRNTRLEVAWTAAPALTLAVVFVLMLGTLRDIGAATDAQLHVRATGHQWWWEFAYSGIVTANEMHIPIDTTIDLELASVDVNHSFWVPELGGKTDMIPGQINHLRLLTHRPGVYLGQCAEFCGVEHAWMRIRVVAESKDDFDRWLAAQALPATASGPGAAVFQANTCVNCHAIRGTGAHGTAGPDLTHLAGRATIAAGVLPSDAASIRAWLADPQRYKPGAFMPRVPLTDADLDALASYLVSLK